MVKTHNSRKRLLSSHGWFFAFGVLFSGLWFGLSSYYRPTFTDTSSIFLYYQKYGAYLPLVLGFLTIVKSYLLLGIFSLIHLRGFIIKMIIYFVLYGFWLTLGIQLTYFEPHYTNLGTILIDGYGFSLLIASSVTLSFVILLAFFKKNTY